MLWRFVCQTRCFEVQPGRAHCQLRACACLTGCWASPLANSAARLGASFCRHAAHRAPFVYISSTCGICTSDFVLRAVGCGLSRGLPTGTLVWAWMLMPCATDHNSRALTPVSSVRAPRVDGSHSAGLSDAGLRPLFVSRYEFGLAHGRALAAARALVAALVTAALCLLLFAAPPARARVRVRARSSRGREGRYGGRISSGNRGRRGAHPRHCAPRPHDARRTLRPDSR
jgi:hypothetical protein